MRIERRIVASNLEVRTHDDSSPKLVGYAAVFHRDSDMIFGDFIERIAPGAFAASIAEKHDVRGLINHDPNLILGRTISGTLTLREDAHGLWSEIDPPDTSYARDLLVSTQRGDISQMSFGFETIEDSWTRGELGQPDIRTLVKVRLFDVSPVTFPAYPDTDVAVRSHQAFRRADHPAPVVDELAVRRRRNELEAIAR